jgi:hypothetical protein
MVSVTWEAYMILGPFRVCVLLRNMTQFLAMASGCGLIQHTHVRHGQLVHSRDLLVETLRKTKKPTTIMFQRHISYLHGH